MYNATFDSKQFDRDMKGLIDYSVGFLDGIQRGKNIFISNLGKNIIDILGNYIDANARVNPAMLHHVYEWEKTGSPAARLFDLDYRVRAGGLSVNSTLRQSMSVQYGSTQPFYNKAEIMEKGIPVVIRPRAASVLSFNDNGEQVFTKKPVVVENPGGVAVEGAFERTFDSFFSSYFTQAFLQNSGVAKYLSDLDLYNKGFAMSKRGGRALGVRLGFQWITKAGANV